MSCSNRLTASYTTIAPTAAPMQVLNSGYNSTNFPVNYSSCGSNNSPVKTNNTYTAAYTSPYTSKANYATALSPVVAPTVIPAITPAAQVVATNNCTSCLPPHYSGNSTIVYNGKRVDIATSATPDIGGYAGNPNVTYCNVNQPFRDICFQNSNNPVCDAVAQCLACIPISSGTYNAVTSNSQNNSQNNTNGLVPLTSYGCAPSGFTAGNFNPTQFASHWIQTGNIFTLSGLGGFGVTLSPASATAPFVNTFPNPQFAINLPICTRLTSNATISGIAFGYVVGYSGALFAPNSIPSIIGVYPILYSLTTGQGAYVQMTVAAPNGLVPVAQASTVSVALLVQYELKVAIS